MTDMAPLQEIETQLKKVEASFARFAPDMAVQSAATRRRAWRFLHDVGRRLRRAVIATCALTLGVLAYAILLGPIGIGGVILTFLALPFCALAAFAWPTPPRPAFQTIVHDPQKTDPQKLTRQASQWISDIQDDLPGQTLSQTHAIADRLSNLSQQLGPREKDDLETHQLERLVGIHLPGLIDNYLRIPAHVRARDPDIDQQLAASLDLVDKELARLSTQLAAREQDAFRAHGHFFKNRYGDDGPGSL